MLVKLRHLNIRGELADCDVSESADCDVSESADCDHTLNTDCVKIGTTNGGLERSKIVQPTADWNVAEGRPT
ncbi:hypothetical protein J6590_037103 [Homalodisca vitripennis]|nr:hypothetical protein J6590_037103 [Homalodisca vitripennis]